MTSDDARSPAPLVKLCGLRGPDDARAAVRAGADAVGIVLVPGARRRVPPPTAAAMVRAIREAAAEARRPPPEVVGVVGRAPLSIVTRLAPSLRLDALQLVGEDEDCARVADALDGVVPLIRAIAVPDEDAGLEGLEALAREWEARGARVTLDAHAAGALGGTGRRIAAERVRPLLAGPACRGLAGGLTPENVAAAVRDLRPALVDVSSGIEARAGRKDPQLMRAFVAAVRAAGLDLDGRGPDPFAAPSPERRA